MRDTLSAVLSPEGCRVTCFTEGQAFLAAARMRTPACILLDVNMPGRSGLDCCANWMRHSIPHRS